MDIKNIELCASYWTLAGDTYPGSPNELSSFSLRDRVEAAGKAGWRGMGFLYADMSSSIAHYGIQTVRNLFGNNNIKHLELELLVDWYLGGKRRATSDKMFHSMLDMASQLNIKKFKLCAGMFEKGHPDLPRMREALVELCLAASPLGIDLVVEFMPFASINTIELGVALTHNLGVDNVGLLIDTWHVHRGGMTAFDISTIPNELVKAVELDDAGPQIIGNILNDSSHHRRLCGEGVIDLRAQIQSVVNSGYRGYWGVEIISQEHRKLPVDIAASRAFETTISQFDEG